MGDDLVEIDETGLKRGNGPSENADDAAKPDSPAMAAPPVNPDARCQFGTVRGFTYIVDDVEKAAAEFSKSFGIGPFFLVDRAPFHRFTYKRRSYEPHLAGGVCFAGETQIVLTQAKNSAPSLVTDYLKKGRKGLAFVSFWTSDLDSEIDRLSQFELHPLEFVELDDGNDRYVTYGEDNPLGLAFMLQQFNGTAAALFDTIRQACAAWDGETRSIWIEDI